MADFKNILINSTIEAQGDVHIGDKITINHHHYTFEVWHAFQPI